jgi:hypothetical protein
MASGGLSTQATINSTFQPVFNAAVPKEGPKAIPLVLDFTAVQTIQVDLTQQQQSARISFLQGAFIDNSQNMSPLSIQSGQSQQVVTIPPQSQAFMPLLLPNPPIFNAATLGSAKVTIIVLNVPMDIAVWSVNGEGDVVGGKLQVQDAALEALISGGALKTADQNLAPLISNLGGGDGLAVNVVSGGGGGSGNLKYEWNTTYLATASDVNLFTPASGEFFNVQGMALYLDSQAFLTGGGPIRVQIQESGAGGGQMQFFFNPPSAAPGPGSTPKLIWKSDDMGWHANVAGASVQMTLDTTLSSGDGVFAVFGAASSPT